MGCFCNSIVYLFFNCKSKNSTRINFRSIDEGFQTYSIYDWITNEYSIFGICCLQIPIGILSDRFGPNFFLIIGASLNGVGTLIYSLAPNEFILFLARLLVGMGDATIWVNLVLILSQWFKVKEFVGLLGLAGMTGSLDFLMATVPFSAWITLSGWRAPFFTIGIMLCLCGVLLYFVLVKKPKQL